MGTETTKKSVDLIHRVILPCSEVTRLLADPAQPALPLRRRIALRVHMALCRFCSEFKKQLPALRRHSHDAGQCPGHHSLPADAREKIRRSLTDPKP